MAGTPVVVKAENADVAINITMPYELPGDIDETSLRIYGKVLEEGTIGWQPLESTANAEERTLTAKANLSRHVIEGEAQFAIMGLLCINCLKAEFKKVYDPGDSRDAVIMVHGFQSNPERWNDIIDRKSVV